MPNWKTKEGTGPPCRMERSHAIWGVGEAQKLGGTVRLGWVRGLVFNFPWAISNKHVDHDEVGNDAEKIAVQRMETRRKTRGQQMRHTMLFQTPESGNHYDFCLIP